MASGGFSAGDLPTDCITPKEKRLANQRTQDFLLKANPSASRDHVDGQGPRHDKLAHRGQLGPDIRKHDFLRAQDLKHCKKYELEVSRCLSSGRSGHQYVYCGQAYSVLQLWMLPTAPKCVGGFISTFIWCSSLLPMLCYGGSCWHLPANLWELFSPHLELRSFPLLALACGSLPGLPALASLIMFVRS